MRFTPLRLLGAAALLCASVANAQQAQPEETATAKLVKAAMAAEARGDADRERDGNRKPVQTLDFLGLEPDMHVLELLAGGGWYSKLLAPTLAEDGKLYLAIAGARSLPILEGMGYDKVEVIDDKAEFAPTDQFGVFELTGVELPKNKFDMVLTFRNYHNFTAESRANLNEAVFKALKPGGIYGVIDHTRRHMEPIGPENWRRADPVVAIKEILDAGFEFVDYSDLHRRPDDELLYDTARKSVTGNSDRFTFKFMKPKRR